MDVNIGTLAGRIEFEDKISTTMESVLKQVTALDAKFGGIDTSVRSVAGGFIVAELALSALDAALDVTIGLVKDFTTEGAAIADVEDNFNNLTESAGRVGETMLGVLRDGTHNTIDDFTLMKTVNDQFAAGIQLTDEQMKTLAEGGFALAQAKGIDVADAFDTVNTAMLTGQVRAVQLLTGKIDLAKAEEDYAKTLSTTTDRLTAQEKQEAARLAILKAVGDATQRLGEQTDGVDEIIAQVSTEWENFYNGLIKGVAASPNVVNAFTAIRDSLFETFGGSGELLDDFLAGVNDVADWVADNAPTVIGWFGHVRDAVVTLWSKASDAWHTYSPIIMGAFDIVKDFVIGVYEAVISTWNALPDWMKTVAERSAITAVGLYAISAGADAAAGSILDTAASFATITSGFASLPDLLGKIAGGFATMKTLWAVMEFTSISGAVASFQLLAGSIASTIGPLGIAALYAGALYAAYELGKWEPISDFFFELGLELQGFSQAEQDAMIAAEKATKAQQEQSGAVKEGVDVQKMLDEIQQKLNTSTIALTQSVNEQGDAVAAVSERNKDYAMAWEALGRLGSTYEDTLQGVNENLRASVIEYAKLGATVENLYQAFPQLTKAQAEAAVASVAAAKEIRAVHDETFGILAKSHGDNINDFIEGEQRKLAVVLESLKLQGKLTDEMYDAQMAKFDALIEAEISKRNEANDQSRDFYEKLVNDAQAAYDLIMQDSTRYTDAEVRESRRLLEERKRDLEHWTSVANSAMQEQTAVVIEETTKQGEAVANLGSIWEQTVGRAIEESKQMVRTLGGEIITAGEYADRQRAGGTMDIQPLTKTELNHLRGNGGDEALKQLLSQLEDRQGTYAPKSKEQYLGMINDQVLLSQLRMYFNDESTRPMSEIPGFRNGGYGDFGDGTLAMLHGEEYIIPADKMSGGNVTNTFYVNGTGQDVARVVSDVLMQQLKSTRQFGAV